MCVLGPADLAKNNDVARKCNQDLVKHMAFPPARAPRSHTFDIIAPGSRLAFVRCYAVALWINPELDECQGSRDRVRQQQGRRQSGNREFKGSNIIWRIGVAWDETGRGDVESGWDGVGMGWMVGEVG